MTVVDSIPHGTSRGYDRHRCRCDVCSDYKRAYNRAYYLANKARVNEQNRAYYAANRDRERARQKTYHASHYLANKARIDERNRQYFISNREKVYEYRRSWLEARPEYSKEWRQANPDRWRQYIATSRAKRLQVEALIVTSEDWRRLCVRYRSCCAYCGKHCLSLTQDHVVPLSRGGRHSIGNIVPACRSCNSSKHARLLIEWRHSAR
jgi:5-methylcytosine-specific restriction endonuclease McrA